MRNTDGTFAKGHNSKPIKTRLFDKIDKTPDCWKWTGHKNNKGYGVVNVQDRGGVRLAHRVMYEEFVGQIPEGKVIMHLCDNPSCVRPDHLKAGTQLENMQDMHRKGRARLDEKRTQSKLNWEKVNYIRERYAKGDISQRELAKSMGISQAILCGVIKGYRWI